MNELNATNQNSLVKGSGSIEDIQHEHRMHRSSSTSILGNFFHKNEKSPTSRGTMPETTSHSEKLKQFKTMKRTFSKNQNVVMISLSKLKSEHLPRMDKNGFCDPYVVVDILPFEYSTDLHVDHYAAKTKILHKTCNPVWDTSKMHINTCASDVDELVKHGALALTLFDHDTFSKDQIIGRVVIDLSECRAVEEGHGETKGDGGDGGDGGAENTQKQRTSEVTMHFHEIVLCNGVRVTGQPMTLSPSTVSGTLSIHTRGGGMVLPPEHVKNDRKTSSRSPSPPGSSIGQGPGLVKGPVQGTANAVDGVAQSRDFAWKEISGNDKTNSDGGMTCGELAEKQHNHTWKEMTGNQTPTEIQKEVEPHHQTILNPLKRFHSSTRMMSASPINKSDSYHSSNRSLRKISSDVGATTARSMRGGAMSESSSSSTTPTLSSSLSHADSDEPRGPTVICGWLKKRDSRSIFGRSTWRTRWFEMDRKTCMLTYHLKQNEEGEQAVPHAYIQVQQYLVRDLGDLEWELTPPKKCREAAACAV